ncbi:hypothetical protein ACIP01_08705 [Pseudomonas monteilii]|uniref:hypothetical protein n=1 Tax=Pseudomonas monteilii TaxID=76759 RepID=UPI003802943C
MDDVDERHGPQGNASQTAVAVLPLPEIRLLDGDTLDLDKLGDEKLQTHIKYPGIAPGQEVSVQFFGCGENGEIFDRPPKLEVINELEPDGSFLVEIDNSLLKSLDKGVAFYSYTKTDFPKAAPQPVRAEEASPRLFFYINKQVDAALLMAPPHFMESDGLVIDLKRVQGDGQVITTNYPFMTVGDTVVLSWKDAFMPDTFRKTITVDDLDKPLVWRIDSSFLQLAGGWCELGYTIEYQGGGKSHSPVQRFTIVDSSGGQSPSLPAPEIPGHSGGMLDPSQYEDGLPVEVQNYGVVYGDELLLTASGKQVSRATLRVDRSIQDSGRLRFRVPGEWLQNHVGEPVKLTWQWARAGAAADSVPLELVLRKPLDLKVPFVDEATPKDPEEGEVPDPDMVQFGFIFPDRLRAGAYVSVPTESETNGGHIIMHWGEFEKDEPIEGNNLKFKIPTTAVPAHLGKRVKVFYTVEDSDGVKQASPAYGLKIEPLENSNFEAVQCPKYPAGTISLSSVTGSVDFYLSSNSWWFFDKGQIVRVYVKGKAKPGEPQLPDEVIRDDEPVSEDEWFYDELKMELSKAYLEKLELNAPFNVYTEISFDEGANFVQGKSAEFTLQA